MSVADILGPNGPFAQKMPGYEERSEQIRMARVLEGVLAKRAAMDVKEEYRPLVAMVEGATGVGKGMAYLIPTIAALFDPKTEMGRVIVGTANIALQEQLIKKDLPFLRGVLPWPFQYSLLKGRSNYLCLRKWNELLPDMPNQLKHRVTYEKLRTWVEETLEGDKSELDFDVRAVWPKISTRGDECLGRSCPYKGDCYSMAARRRVNSSHVVVINYHVLLASFRYNMGLPSYEVLVCDEAHQLPDIARSIYTDDLSMGTPHRLGGRVREFCDKSTRDRLINAVRMLLDHADEFVGEHEKHATRIYHDELDLKFVVASLEEMREEIALKEPPEHEEEKHAKWAIAAEGVLELQSRCARLSRGTDDEAVRWVAFDKNDSPELHGAPLKVDDILRPALVDDELTTVVTSATLTTGGKFSFLRNAMGIPKEFVEAEQRIESPFDYREQGRLFIPRIVDPRHEDYFDEAWEVVEEIVPEVQGGVLVLCTSNKSMKEFYLRLRRLVGGRARIQGQASRGSLMEMMKQEQCVLVATRSFFEGVDLPGSALSCVIIDKLPFPVPTDPVVSELQNALERETGKMGWFLYSLPAAVIAMCQASGRVIRRSTDVGLVVVLDSRLNRMSYKDQFLDSMPPFRRTREVRKALEFLRSKGA